MRCSEDLHATLVRVRGMRVSNITNEREIPMLWSGMIGKGVEHDHCRSLTPARKPQGLGKTGRIHYLCK